MTALSLTQPWATLVAIGAKRIETRSWSTRHRGPLAIHSAKGFPRWAIKWALKSLAIRLALAAAGYKTLNELPRGAVIATCNLADVVCITAENLPPVPERLFGNYTPGRYAWCLTDVRMLHEPIPAKGTPVLWEWEGELPAVVMG